MHKKKFFAKLVLASVLTGGINFLPAVPIFHAGNFQVSVAHAEIKTFAAKNTAMTDVESLTNAAKSTAQERALNLAQKKAETFLKTLSPTLRGRLTDEDISAVVINNFKIVNAPLYRKLYYQAVDENGNDLGRNGEIYEATVTINIDTAALDKYRKLGAQDREKLIKQAQNAQAAFEEIDRDFEELRKNARTKSPKQLQADIDKFDAKISKVEKSRKKNQSATPPAIVQDKPAITENKPAPPVTNQPMQFSQPVKIGSISYPPVNGMVIENAIYCTGTKKTEKGRTFYEIPYGNNVVAQFGNGNDTIYFHYIAREKNYFGKEYFGDKDINSAIQLETGIYGTNIFQVKNTSSIKFYLLGTSEADIAGVNFIVLGKQKNGKFVKFIDFKETVMNYFGKKNKFEYYPTYSSANNNGIYFKNDSIIIKYSSGRKHNIPSGEFRFKWDEAAQWFSVEKITY